MIKQYNLVRIISVLLFVFCRLTLQSQENSIDSPVEPVEIGSSVPEKFWKTKLQVINHPEKEQSIILEQYQGKLLILDFWGTYCSSCIARFPKLKKIIEDPSLGDKIKILAVSPEPKDRLEQFFSSDAGTQYSYINSAFEDKVLSKYFPHLTVPHVAWISPSGTLLSTTSADDITIENIEAILNQQNTSMDIKIDLDKNNPLFLSDNFYINDMGLSFYSIFSKGYYPGYPFGSKIRKSANGKVYGRQMTNRSLMGIYRTLGYEIFKRKGESLNKKRIIIEVKDPTELDVKLDSESMIKDHKEKYYNYELIIPENKADSLYHYMITDLNRYTDYIVSVEKRAVDCLVLVPSPITDKLKAKDTNNKSISETSPLILDNFTTKHLTNLLNELPIMKYPIIDETRNTKNIEIVFQDIEDLERVKKDLNKHGLDLMLTTRNLLMFVITDK